MRSEERVREVLRGLLRNPSICLEDKVYDVREDEGQGWEGPNVKAWGKAVEDAEALLAELEAAPTGD